MKVASQWIHMGLASNKCKFTIDYLPSVSSLTFMCILVFTHGTLTLNRVFLLIPSETHCQQQI